MITAYRIGKQKYADDPLSGLGGLSVGGRWHHKGLRVVYCAGHLSLASLEFFVHFSKLQSAIPLVSFELVIPKPLIEELRATQLPADWDALPPSSSTADLGTAWLKSLRTAVLRVPSVVSPGEYNFLINPAHPNAGRIKVAATSLFTYDSRMWKDR